MKQLFAAACAVACVTAAPAYAWEPTKPIEIVVPFGPGGASDQMARTLQGLIQKHSLSPQPVIVVNKPAAAGGEAMMDIQKSARDPHKLLTTSSGIYMTPLSTKMPVNWRDFTPVAMLAQDEFLIWAQGSAPYKTLTEFIEAAKTASPPFKIGGAGSKREDDLITFALGAETGVKFAYIPYKSGGETSTQLAGGHIQASTGNPSEEIGSFKGGTAKPLCLLSEKRMRYTTKVANDMSWSDVPTCGEQGVKFTYNMLRGIFMPGRVTPEQQAFYVDMFKKAVETPEWKDYLERSGLLPDFRDGKPFEEFLTADEAKHKELMGKAGFLPTN
ncbi:tripartite tricarboxylate transporter substrate binding protein [Chenggangzhangella methanolivorans]|uniref:Tripartite tricarboxylate transporter substrate binding protein n=1 Tax=Chenggangzhangella methanolivorans TaxID=1437009 RepID=A0A9E6UNU1_9HYPH|nr:tripartite tricarboxylate transporter substrate-binding protein [Chenggangzhangella methanolivorans]QZN98954.1 tripartite tricarboxylate transporter substrate binding protein [Chenggangzhangella methanolivorans]